MKLKKIEYSNEYRGIRRRSILPAFVRETFVDLFALNGTSIGEDIFHKIKAPVFAIDGYNLIINPCLRKYELFKTVDPFTVYQNISMFIPGVLGTQAPEMVDISDKDMLIKKGFDKTSFKTISPGKKYRRRLKVGANK